MIGELRHLESPSAWVLADLTETFEDLQTVLRCCERLMTELAASKAPADVVDDVVVEAVWTLALLSYARCFAAGKSTPDKSTSPALSDDDVKATQPAEALEWHTMLLQLRDHYADPTKNPRERFSVGVAQDPIGGASGVALTSARQPLVDEVTVRQTGAIAYALSALVNDRITTQQEKVFAEAKAIPRADLARLPRLDVAQLEPEQ